MSHKKSRQIITATKKIWSTSQRKNTKISYNTIELMKVRRKLDKTTQQYKALNKTIKKEIRKDTRAFKTNLIKKCIEDSANMRVLKSKLAVGRAKLVKIKNTQGIDTLIKKMQLK